MDYGMTAVLIAGGLALLALGGDFVVRGGVGLARALGVTPLVIGVVFLGFATSLPELFTSLQGVLQGSPGVALGNVVGSNIANLLLIAGVASAIATTKVRRLMIWRDGMFVLGSSMALVALLLTQESIGRLAGAGLLAVLITYLVVALATEKKSDFEEEEAPTDGAVAAVAFFVLGVAATIGGAYALVSGAVSLARDLGAPESLIGLTVVALGTSLPELAAAIAAGIRRQPELAVGNVLGSNVFNVCAIVGLTAMARPIETPNELVNFDVWAMLAATLVMLFFAYNNRQLSRTEGAALLLCYVLYIGATVSLSDWSDLVAG